MKKYTRVLITQISGVHPDFRRMGVSKKIGIVDGQLCLQAEIDFLYLVTVNPVVIKNSYKTQILFPHQIKNLVWIKDIQTHIEATNIENPFGMKASFYAKNALNILDPEHGLLIQRSKSLKIHTLVHK